MKNWQEDQVQLLQTNQAENYFFYRVAVIAYELGFDYCAYGLRTPLPASKPKVVMHSNYPVEWQIKYRVNNYMAIDPTVQHCSSSFSPVVWSNDLFSTVREFWEEARSFGLHVGWAQSTCNEYGFRGMLTVARSYEDIAALEYRDLQLKMAWLTQLAHLGISKRLVSQLMPVVEARLTEREKAVLRWTADGKTSGEISDILNISERTVNFHINNAVDKLGAPNKLAAAVRAAVLDLL